MNCLSFPSTCLLYLEKGRMKVPFTSPGWRC
ncbi:rCG51019, isoform CRA_a [Rattus norvegicus]|uniref:RCG51019, isoform CRA_a n=1 Tax=Rattus norvegicus TaxID=10116 RepID=A6KGE8_RAT|nr:rCG51019, isoform CRA_a [Rattus norvegicus]